MNLKTLAITILALSIQGCVDFDLFGRSTKTVVGAYELKRWEDFKTYYLYGPQKTPWGALDGTVDKIGWNEDFILVLQHDDGNGGGWRIIDAESETISKVYELSESEEREELKGIAVFTAATAWEKL